MAKLDRVFDAVYKVEMWIGFSLGHLNAPLQAFQTFLMMKLVFDDTWLAFGAVMLGVIALTISGWWGVERQNFLKRQNRLANKHNEALMRAARLKK